MFYPEKRKMLEFGDDVSKLLIDDKDFYINEHNALVENLSAELKFCKDEQFRLRAELNSVREETRISTEMAQEHFRFHEENRFPESQEQICNLEKRLEHLQSEKDSIFQLWQMALKAIDVLEEQLIGKAELKKENENLKSENSKLRSNSEKLEIRLTEAKKKVAESIDLVELSIAEKRKMEVEFARENSNFKEFLGENEELKSEIRQKATLLDRSQRDFRLLEEEFEKIKKGYEEMLGKSQENVSVLEKKLRETKIKCGTLEEQIELLQGKIANFSLGNLRLEKGEVQNSRILEERLTRALEDKEKLGFELRGLQMALERESGKRDHEKKTLEMKIRELQEDLRNASNDVDRTNRKSEILAGQISAIENEVSRKSEKGYEGCFSNSLHGLKERYENKFGELTRHVEAHQKLSKKWKEEAKLLTAKFHKRSKELNSRLKSLRSENAELHKELSFCRQKLARYRVQIKTRVEQGPS